MHPPENLRKFDKTVHHKLKPLCPVFRIILTKHLLFKAYETVKSNHHPLNITLHLLRNRKIIDRERVSFVLINLSIKKRHIYNYKKLSIQ